MYRSDRWTLELAELGYEREAEQLARMALLCEPPYVTALDGSGGSGKTSVMRYAMALLGGGATLAQHPHDGSVVRDDGPGDGDGLAAIREHGRQLMQQHGVVGLVTDSDDNPLGERSQHRAVAVWFNPWRARNEHNPVAALLRVVCEQLAVWARNASWTATHARVHFESGLHLLGQLADSVGRGAGNGNGAVTGAPAISSLDSAGMQVAGAIERAPVTALELLSDTERFRLLFERAVASILGVVDAKSKRKGKQVAEFASAEQHRLVVFIDDLDRCDSATVRRVLEALELYLSTRYSVFVIGADLRAVRASLAADLGAVGPALAADQLERSVHNRMRLAPSERCPLFVHNRLAEWRLIDAKPIAASEYRDLSATHALARLIADVLPGNPRKVKAYLSSLRLAWELARTRTADLSADDLPAFALIHRLQGSAPRVFELLCRDTDYHLRVLQDFFEHCKSRTPYRPDPAHAAACALMVDAFRPMVNLDGDWRDAALTGTVRVEPTPITVDALLADRQFARRWRDAGINAAAIRRYAGRAGGQ